jgi:hypothetical protein
MLSLHFIFGNDSGTRRIYDRNSVKGINSQSPLIGNDKCLVETDKEELQHLERSE